MLDIVNECERGASTFTIFMSETEHENHNVHNNLLQPPFQNTQNTGTNKMSNT